MKLSFSASMAVLALVIGCSAQAQITTYNDRGVFDAAVGPTTVEDFGGTAQFPITTGVLNSSTNLVVPNGPPIVPGEILPGVTYSTPIGTGNFFNIDAGGGFVGGFLDGLNNTGNNPPLTVTFDSPVQAFGFDTNALVGSDFTISIADSTGGYTNTVAITNGFTPSFFGFASALQDITSLTLSDNSPTFTFALDNFTWTAETPASSTPEPGAYAMFAAGGLSGMGFLLRRRRKA